MNFIDLIGILLAIIGFITLFLSTKVKNGDIKLVYIGIIAIIGGIIIVKINSKVKEMEIKENYLIKIEQVLSKKNAPNKELIVKELKNKTLEELQEYYLKKLEE